MQYRRNELTSSHRALIGHPHGCGPGVFLFMTQIIATPAVGEYLTRHLAEVFSTMLSLPAAVHANAVPSSPSERVTSSVGFVGETVAGAVYLHVPSPLAARIAGAMLGLPPTEIPADPDVNDVMGEVANMLAGGLKSWLCDQGATCALSTPAIIRGCSFKILPSEGVSQLQFGFTSESHEGMLEVHIKFAP
jgi:chemotaxis protein CheX